MQRTDTSVDALRRTQQPTCSFWDVRQLSGRCQAAGQRVFRTSRAAEMIEGSIVRLQPLVGACWNSQPRRICPPCGFQCFMPACQADMVVLRGTFRHLDLKTECIGFILVFFSIKVCIWAPTFEIISKSYSHVFLLALKQFKKVEIFA